MLSMKKLKGIIIHNAQEHFQMVNGCANNQFLMIEFLIYIIKIQNNFQTEIRKTL